SSSWLRQPAPHVVLVSAEFFHHLGLLAAHFVHTLFGGALGDDVNDLRRYALGAASDAVDAILGLEVEHRVEAALEEDRRRAAGEREALAARAQRDKKRLHVARVEAVDVLLALVVGDR